MKQIVAVLADYASISVGGKLNILGIFSNIIASNAPVVHPQMQLVFMYEFEFTEAGNKDMKIVLVDDDGREILSMSGEVNVHRLPHGAPCQIYQIIQLNDIRFPKFGEYEFHVLINDGLVSTVPLKVIQAPEPQN